MIDNLVLLLAAAASLSSASPITPGAISPTTIDKPIPTLIWSSHDMSSIQKRGADWCANGGNSSWATTGNQIDIFCNTNYNGFNTQSKSGVTSTADCFSWCVGLNKYLTIPQCFGFTWIPSTSVCYAKNGVVGNFFPTQPSSGVVSHSGQLIKSIQGYTLDKQCFNQPDGKILNATIGGYIYELHCGYYNTNGWQATTQTGINTIKDCIDWVIQNGNGVGTFDPAANTCYAVSSTAWGGYYTKAPKVLHGFRQLTGPSDDYTSSSFQYKYCNGRSAPGVTNQTLLNGIPSGTTGTGDFLYELSCGNDMTGHDHVSQYVDNTPDLASCIALCDATNKQYGSSGYGYCGGVTYYPETFGCNIKDTTVTPQSEAIQYQGWWVDSARLLPAVLSSAPANSCGSGTTGTFTFANVKFAVTCNADYNGQTYNLVAQNGQNSTQMNKESTEDCMAWCTQWNSQYPGNKCYGISYSPSSASCFLKNSAVQSSNPAQNTNVYVNAAKISA